MADLTALKHLYRPYKQQASKLQHKSLALLLRHFCLMSNKRAWSGEITWDLLLGTNTLRNLHFNAPLSVSLQNEGFTLSLVCDSYRIAQADSAIAAVLVPYETAAQRRRLSTTTETNAAIAAALVPGRS